MHAFYKDWNASDKLVNVRYRFPFGAVMILFYALKNVINKMLIFFFSWLSRSYFFIKRAICLVMYHLDIYNYKSVRFNQIWYLYFSWNVVLLRTDGLWLFQYIQVSTHLVCTILKKPQLSLVFNYAHLNLEEERLAAMLNLIKCDCIMLNVLKSQEGIFSVCMQPFLKGNHRVKWVETFMEILWRHCNVYSCLHCLINYLVKVHVTIWVSSSL